MKVIFLDIDGVLNNQQTFQSRYEHHQSTGEWLLEIDETMVARLTNIVKETNAKIVLSSSWRTGFSYDTCEPLGEQARGLVDILNKYSLSIYSRTGNGKDRTDEIEEWLQTHKDIDTFVILDDDSYDLQKFIGRELVKTSFTAPKEMVKDMNDCTGLQDEHVERAIRILNGEKCCETCKNNVEYPPPHTCDICTSLDQEEDYEMWEAK